LAYNYPPEEKIALPLTGTLEQADALDASGSARELSLHLRGLPPGAPFMIETLDQQHGDPIPAWESMGKPEPPNREQTRLLRETAWATQREVIRADNAGVLDLHRTIATWSLVLIKQF
jgi:xylan 1,4-beta-xylosidase